MGFSQRAIDACVSAMESGTVSERHVRDVLRCDNVDVKRIEPFLLSGTPEVRRMAAKIVGKMGDVCVLIEAALKEQDRTVLSSMLQVLGERGEGVGKLTKMLLTEDRLIKEEIISMYRRAGKASLLFPLLFDGDDFLVSRIKRYINEQDKDPIS